MKNYLHYSNGIFNHCIRIIFIRINTFWLYTYKVFLKKDIRDIGSGNIGATNALRAGNKTLGYATLLLDITKAILPVLYVKFNYPDYIFIASLSAFLGHVFPIWLKFKGGKGVATYVGILFSINSNFGFNIYC